MRIKCINAFNAIKLKGKLRSKPCLLGIYLLLPLLAFGQGRYATEIESLVASADVNIQQSQFVQALDSLTRAYDLSRSEVDSNLTRSVLNSIANTYYNLDQLDQAERFYNELVEHDNEQQDWAALSVSLFNLAHVYGSKQEFLLAERTFERSLALSRTVEDELGASYTLKALGVNAHAQENYASALNYLNNALQGFESMGDDPQTAIVLRNLGDVEQALGQYDNAVAYYREALPVLAISSQVDALLRAYRGLSDSYSQLFDYENAYVTQRAYAQLLQQQLMQENAEVTRVLQVQFETQRFADENERLAIVGENQSLVLAQRDSEVRMQSLVLAQRDNEVKMQRMALGFAACLIVIGLAGLEIFRRHAKKLRLLASTDVLTGLLNRRAIMSFANREWTRSARFKRPLSCLMFDIDHFKSINDTYGHGVGDQVLRAISNTLKSTLRQTDGLGRFGGEEFLLIATETELDQVKVLAERIRERIESLEHKEMDGKKVTVSIGLAQLADEASLEDLIKHADQALYHSKDEGRNQVTVFTREEQWSLVPAV